MKRRAKLRFVLQDDRIAYIVVDDFLAKFSSVVKLVTPRDFPDVRQITGTFTYDDGKRAKKAR